MQERINKIRAVSESTAELLQAAYNKLLEKIYITAREILDYIIEEEFMKYKLYGGVMI